MATKITAEESVEAVQVKEKIVEKTASKGTKVELASEVETTPPKKPAATKTAKAAVKESGAQVNEPSGEAVAKKKASAPKTEKAVPVSKPAKAEPVAAKAVEKVTQPKKESTKAGKEPPESDNTAVQVSKKPAKKAEEIKSGPIKSDTPRLKRKYADEVVPAMREKFQYGNVMQVPKLEKMTLSMGLGAEKDNPKGIETAVLQLGLIAGQKAVIVKAKKSVANFKVRAGMNIGAKVTLRGDRMYYFADKLMNIVLPRVRDFRGVSDDSFDGRGNYAMGLKEQLIFPEISYDDVDRVRGMNVVFVTSAKTDEEAKALLSMLGMPFAQG